MQMHLVKTTYELLCYIFFIIYITGEIKLHIFYILLIFFPQSINKNVIFKIHLNNINAVLVYWISFPSHVDSLKTDKICNILLPFNPIKY